MYQFRADAAEGQSFIGEQLQYIFPEVIRIVYAENEWQNHLPLETGGDPAVKEMGFDIFTPAGMAEMFVGDGEDLPEVDGQVERVVVQVYDFGVKRKIDDLTVERAALAVRNAKALGQTNPIAFDKELETTAAQAINERHEDIAINGVPTSGILGLVNQPNIGAYSAVNGASGSPLWENKTAEEIVADLTNWLAASITAAKNQQYFPDYMLLPMNKWLIATTKKMEGTDTTALAFFEKNNALGTNLKIGTWQRLNGKGPSGSGLGFLYRKRLDVISYRSPRLYHVHTPPARSVGGWRWLHSMRSAGVGVKRPFAVFKMQGF